MHPQVSALFDKVPASYIFAGTIVALVVVYKLCKRRNLNAIPTVGTTIWPGAWYMNATEVMQEGYEKYKCAPFKLADRFNWIVVLSSREHREELRKAPEDVLSFNEAVNDLQKTKFTVGPEVYHNQYHFDVLRSHLPRNVANLYDAIREEITVGFDEVLNLRDNEWKTVTALPVVQQVICRTSNRLFVGLPLCRNAEWLHLTLRYTLDVMFATFKINLFPEFLAPLVVFFMTNIPWTMRRTVKLLTPVIEERVKLMKEHGKDWEGKPNDVLSWLLDEAPEGPERTAKLLTTRILSICFAAIHTSSNSFVHAIFYLAENPQYIQPLREEVESIVAKEGWSKTSLGKMRKIDSFMKECQRVTGITSVGLTRKAVKDFTFSDGTFIPKGTSIVAPARSLHFDDEYYRTAHEFDPFRFSDLREEDGAGIKHQYVTTNLEYLPFGHGKHACPGRFFVANELKSMLAHIVVSYDVKLEDNAPRPKEMIFGAAIIPDQNAKVMFRKRGY